MSRQHLGRTWDCCPDVRSAHHEQSNRNMCDLCRGSLAFSNSSDAATDSSSGMNGQRGMYGLTMGEGGSAGIGRGGQSVRRGGMALFNAAPSEGADARKAAKSSIYGTMAFSDMEKENKVLATSTLDTCIYLLLYLLECAMQ